MTLRDSSVPSPFPPGFLAAYKSAASMNNTFRLDEGYSDDTRSQAGSEMRVESRLAELDVDTNLSLLPQWVLGLNEADRSEFAYAILRSLRTSSIAAIVERLNPLLHIDPVSYLPPELTFEIFSYLDTPTLLRASTLSKSWRGRALDGRLWRQLLEREGWDASIRRVREFEDKSRAAITSRKESKSRVRSSEDTGDAERSPKKRAREQLFGDRSTEFPRLWGEQHGAIEADDDVTMEDPSPKIEDPWTSNDENTPPQTPPEASADSLDPPIRPSLILYDNKLDPRVNWQYLYKQKRRLEENWQAGRFTNFQLPHVDHPEEAHAECVYTLQYSGKFLVSGSRDKTLRIWNLETQRLAVPPLKGHEASVLCLQFDSRPEQDIVISGGSDCHVILWRFSTGKIINKLRNVHSEPVLNLRFDDRYLITCSKDKTIKVWNRTKLLPTDDAYPVPMNSSSSKFPAYIINAANLLDGELQRVNPLKEYSLLMTLSGHSAAVNAIQILDNQIVSASGDRLVKIWDVKTGICLKTISGHAKGIACVQFDGRRIVSGSSDETVRIFDRVTGVEVACLRGHTNLVRTVQARFGDVPGGQADDEAEARAVDRKFLAANINGALSRKRMTREERHNRNAGSRDPKDIFALGAKLPPGGGGSRWARIVSGSYDETVIIWKRNPDGKWTPAHQLYQCDAVQGAGGQPRHIPAHHPLNAAQAAIQLNQQLQSQLQQQFQQLQNAAAGPQAGTQAQAANPPTIAGPSTAPQNPPPAPAPQAQAAGPAGPPLIFGNPLPHHPVHAHAYPQLPPPPAFTAAQLAAHNGAAVGHHHAPAMGAHHVQHAPHAPGTGANSRVFKLQFDSRRIICCSQDPTIVGWDFANADREIVEASQFFGDEYGA
ncbi:WD40 repeat-like protein [Trichodelitschia bisporula]|uniref:WD40 repeat-like protein n=1 Tax=Trichodelitschia bisporula TaxID=703511 RepID=A0A6G1HZ18_9PEZI|nr:WD40 repeat-like protein [Trichodelitschia bisporula]